MSMDELDSHQVQHTVTMRQESHYVLSREPSAEARTSSSNMRTSHGSILSENYQS